MTLCTCKHKMRAYRDLEQWRNAWVAGFTTLGAGDRSNVLIYLMEVAEAFESHHDLWYGLPKAIRWAKAADVKGNILGDIYRPRGKLLDGERFRMSGYHKPCPSHVHHDGWKKDVDYQSPTRRAALLVGDPKKSFLWSRPVISVPFRIARGQKKMLLIDLLDSLQEV